MGEAGGGAGLDEGARRRVTRPVTLATVLACLAGTLVVGALHKAPCVGSDWGDARQYRFACYSDVIPLLATEQLGGGRLPYLEACAPSEASCDEYPVLTMYLMRVSAWISGPDPASFFWANAAILALAAGLAACCLFVLDPRRSLWFALAPSLALDAFVNWDLLAVALAALATVAFFSRRDGWAGTLLGLGAAAKLFPALLLVPFAADRLRGREPDRAIALWWWAAGAWVAVNLPFAIGGPAGWWEFFRLSGTRPADWDSLWSIACRLGVCTPTAWVNVLAPLLTVGSLWAVWTAKRRRERDFPRWQLAFPLLIAFLVLGKVYSPQFSLWLLPWFALVDRDLRRFVVFEVADVAVFLTRFSFFGELTGAGGLPRWVFEAAVAVRAAVLVWCVVGWVRQGSRELEGQPAAAPTEAAGAA